MSGGTDPVFTITVSGGAKAEWENPFSDVSSTDWFYDSVRYVCENSLFLGTSEASFSPQGTMTRGMLVTVLGRLAEATAPLGDSRLTFDDADSTQYYAPYIAWAAENGIVQGYGENKFRPNDNVTREQVAVILERYIKYAGIEIETTAEYHIFADGEEITEWAKSAVQLMNKLGVVNGTGNGIINPGRSATRAEEPLSRRRWS